MRTAGSTTETEQVHRFSENLTAHFARGKEWATPGVQAALQRAVAGLDTGKETASPRLQAVLRRLADEVAGGVETLPPRVQEQLKRVAPKAAAGTLDRVEAPRPAPRKWWWAGALLGILAAGVAVRRSLQAAVEEPAPSVSAPERAGADPAADAADLAAGRI
jgi:hypothetical protein